MEHIGCIESSRPANRERGQAHSITESVYRWPVGDLHGEDFLANSYANRTGNVRCGKDDAWYLVNEAPAKLRSRRRLCQQAQM